MNMVDEILTYQKYNITENDILGKNEIDNEMQLSCHSVRLAIDNKCVHNQFTDVKITFSRIKVQCSPNDCSTGSASNVFLRT